MIKLRIENYFKYFTDEEEEKYKHGKVYELENLVDAYNMKEEVDEIIDKIACYGSETELEIDPSEPNLMVLSIYD